MSSSLRSKLELPWPCGTTELVLYREVNCIVSFKTDSLVFECAPECLLMKTDCFIRVFCHNLCLLQHMCRDKVKELLAVDTAVVTTPHSTPQHKQEEEEDGYYSSYTHFGIHEEMLRV